MVTLFRRRCAFVLAFLTLGAGVFSPSTICAAGGGGFGENGPGYYNRSAPSEPLAVPVADPQPAQEIKLKAKIVAVADGDTFTAIDANNTEAQLRLHGVDAPEDGQPYDSESKQFASDLTLGKTVDIKIIGTDALGRYVSIITLPDGRVLNDELVGAGLAWWYEQYAPKDKILKNYQDAAKAQKRGLWADADPTPPWEFRQGSPTPEGKLGVFPKASTSAPQVRAQAPQAEPQAAEVYVTRTGKKYHTGGCRYLSQSKIPTDLESAKRAYGPCSVCRPPQ